MTLEENLEKLEKMDKETYEIIQFRLKTLEGIEDWDENILTETGQDILRGCLERAMLMKKDTLLDQFQSNWKGRTTFRALISGALGSFYWGQGNNQAETLLDAYVKL